MKIRNAFKCVLMTAFMCMSSILIIPLNFTTVPITFQSIACLIAGALLGGKGGAASMAVYVILGALGAPVFAGMNSGIGHIFSPTGGFIIGFIPCAYLSGKLSRSFYATRDSAFMQFAELFAAMAVSTMLLHFFGVIHFSIADGCSFFKAVSLASLPFIWPDLLKIVVSSLTVMYLCQFGSILDTPNNLSIE